LVGKTRTDDGLPVDRPSAGIGEKLASLRKQRGLTLVELAGAAGTSPSFLSQLERGTTNASIDTLRRIATALGVPMFHLFVDEPSALWVVRRNGRKRLSYPDSGATYELLVPDLNREMELVLITLDEGRATFDAPFSHAGHECDVVLEGEVQFEIGSRLEALEAGDAIYFDCTIPHRFVNVGHGAARLLSVVSPPTF